MKRRAWTIIISFCISVVVNGQGFLHTDGKQIVDGNGENVILRGIGTGNWMIMEGYMMKTEGTSFSTHTGFRNKLTETIGEVRADSFYSVWLANHFNRNDADSMASWGYNCVRVAMHYKWFTLPIEDEPVAGEQTWLDTGFELLDSLLDWCGDNGMYLILDLHGAPGGQGHDRDISDYDPAKPSLWESQENRDRTIALWAKLAERFKDEPWIGGYDLINEPNWNLGGANVPLKQLYMAITDTIRAFDQNHIIFIEGNDFANNFTGLTPPWDDNLVYSFHKYATYNDAASISWVLNLRNSQNVPIWLGETGENSNVWYTNVIRLCEGENIGWSMWPVKKASINNPWKVTVNEDYTTLINSWKNNTQVLTEEEAFQAVLQFAENHRIENCIFMRDLIDAQFRQPHTPETRPYLEHRVLDTIFASDYDLGRNGIAYYDLDTATYQFAGQDYTTWNQGWAYRNDGVDVETCSDALLTNGYSVGWIDKGEWMQYTVLNDSAAAFKLELRSAAGGAGGIMHVEVDGTDISGPVTLPGTGGWYSWKTTETNEIILPEGEVTLRIISDRSGSNLNYFRFKDPVAVSTLPFKLLSASTAELGNEITITLNKEITNPVDYSEASEWSLFVNNNPQPVDSVRISESDRRLIYLYASGTLLYGQSIRISYNGESIDHDGQILDPVDLATVTNRLARHYNVPGKIQAENFYVNHGLELESCTDDGGGYNTGYADINDYLEYIINVSEAGEYRMNFRIATQYNGARLAVQSDRGEGYATLGTMNFQNTGGWQTWETQSMTVNLEEGKQLLKLLVTGSAHNLNWFEFTSTVGIEQLPPVNPVRIYPNPAREFVVIDLQDIQEDNCNIFLMDIAGRVIRSIHESTLTIDISGYAPGIYLIRIESNEKVYTERLVIE